MFQVKGTGFYFKLDDVSGIIKEIVVVRDVYSVFQQTLETELA